MNATGWSEETCSDEELVAGYLAGRVECFEALIRRHGRELYHFLVRFTGNVAAAEDLVQETFLQVHLSASSFDPKRRFKPWLFTIAANKARDALRRRTRRPEVSLEASVGVEGNRADRFVDFLAQVPGEPSARLEQAEQRQRVRQIVNQMPQHLREVLILGYYHRFGYRQIAEILDVPLGTVKSRLHAAVGYFARAWRAAMQE